MQRATKYNNTIIHAASEVCVQPGAWLRVGTFGRLASRRAFASLCHITNRFHEEVAQLKRSAQAAVGLRDVLPPSPNVRRPRRRAHRHVLHLPFLRSGLRPARVASNLGTSVDLPRRAAALPYTPHARAPRLPCLPAPPRLLPGLPPLPVAKAKAAPRAADHPRGWAASTSGGAERGCCC